MSDALSYTRGSRFPRLLGGMNYVINDFAVYKRLTRSRIRLELAFPAYLVLGIIKIIISPCIYTFDAHPYTRGALVPRLLGMWNYLNNFL